MRADAPRLAGRRCAHGSSRRPPTMGRPGADPACVRRGGGAAPRGSSEGASGGFTCAGLAPCARALDEGDGDGAGRRTVTSCCFFILSSTGSTKACEGEEGPERSLRARQARARVRRRTSVMVLKVRGGECWSMSRELCRREGSRERKRASTACASCAELVAKRRRQRDALRAASSSVPPARGARSEPSWIREEP